MYPEHTHTKKIKNRKAKKVGRKLVLPLSKSTEYNTNPKVVYSKIKVIKSITFIWGKGVLE